MRQDDLKKRELLCTVKPQLKITGVTFSGYGMQYREKEKRIRQENDTEKQEETEGERIPEAPRMVLDRYVALAGVLHSRRENIKLPKKKSGIRNPKKWRKIPPEGEQRINTGMNGNGVGSAGIEREEMIRRCGICEKRAGVSGVKAESQKMEYILSNEQWDAVVEKAVCSIEERQRWQEGKGLQHTGNESGKEERLKRQEGEGQRQTKDESGREQRTDGVGKRNKNRGSKEEHEKKSPDRIKRELIRSFLIKEMLHEEGRSDSDSHFKLLEQLLKYDAGKAAGVIGRLLWKIIRKILLGILIFILGVCVSFIPFIFFLFFVISTYSYFMGFYDEDSEIQGQPQYIKNVVQEMYLDFYGELDAFRDQDGNNQLDYAYRTYSYTQEIIAVYLAETCSSGDFKEMGAQDNYPAYLMIDTAKERAQLFAVFEEFNYYTKQGIELTVTGEDGQDYQVPAEKMTIYCLSAAQWKAAHLPELSEPEAKLLENLLKQAGTATEGEGEYPFDGNAVPITDIVIPAGVDENLVYLAGFIKAEAGNQSSQGKVAVGYVILNRAGGASGNIKGVLTAPYQFSCYIPYHTVEKYLQGYAQMTDAQRSQDACWKAAEAVYYGTAENPIGDMRYYCNPKACSVGEAAQWRRIRANNSEDGIRIIGDHVFCRNCW